MYKSIYDEVKNEWIEDKRNNTYEQIELCDEAKELNDTLIRTNNVIFDTLFTMIFDK